MARARIIAADTDANYIMSLQLKFAEEFFEKIDLEIITEESYFEELFSVPQKAEILIVSEDLYNLSLQRHNIDHVFLMTEQYEEGSTEDLNVNKIYKYTSIKEIFNEIAGKSSESLKGVGDERKEPQIILVYSASGGTGKTTVAFGISTCLTKNYKKVLYINAARLQMFQHMLENDSPITTADIYTKLAVANDKIYNDIKHVIRKEVFYYLPPFKATLMSLGLKYSLFRAIALSAKKSCEYDYVVIDADEAFDEEKAELMNIADKVVIVTNQTGSAVFATNTLVSNINGVYSDKYIFICNDFNKEHDNALITPAVSLKFTIMEYVEHFNHFENLKCDDFFKNSGLQKIAFWLM